MAFASPTPYDSTTLDAAVRALEARYGGHLGVKAKNLKTGETYGYNATERFATASTIKFPVMVAYFDQVKQRKLRPEMNVVLTNSDKRQGSGILQMLSEGTSFTLLDAVTLMIVLSDNAGTNLVLDRFATTHLEKLAVVNDLMAKLGLKNTRILNKVFSYETKQNTPEALRFGLGVSTPEDMVMLLEGVYRRTLIDSASSEEMLGILKQQFYEDMIPRFLPYDQCEYLTVAHKTGFVMESKSDVALILSDRADIALALFVDKQGDHREGIDNNGLLLGAEVARAVWDAFAGRENVKQPRAWKPDVDWTTVPGGRWAIYRTPAALFPHPDRANGFTRKDGTVYPWFPHYADSSVIVFVPNGFTESKNGANLIVHFHGHLNDNLGVLERYNMLQTMVDQRINALLVLAQGPYRARDSFGGKMEDEGGFSRLVIDVLTTMKQEKVVGSTAVDKVIISAHSGGYRPAAFSAARGGMSDKITHLFLYDAFYGQFEEFKTWLLGGKGRIRAAYTDHLSKEHEEFSLAVKEKVGDRFQMEHTTVDHDQVARTFFPIWSNQLSDDWKFQRSSPTEPRPK